MHDSLIDAGRGYGSEGKRVVNSFTVARFVVVIVAASRFLA